MPVPRERPFFSNLPLWEILVAWLRHSSSKSSVTHPYQCVQCFHSSNPPYQCVQCFHSSKQSTAALPILPVCAVFPFVQPSLPVCAVFSFVQTINSSVTHPTSVCSVSIGPNNQQQRYPSYQCVQCFHSSKQSTAALPILQVCALFSFVQTINSSVTHPTSVCSVSIRSTLPASVCNVSIRPINQPQSPAPDLVPISTQQWRRLESHGYLNVLTTFRNIVCHIAPFLDSGREQSFLERRPVC